MLIVEKIYARLGFLRSAPTRYHIWHYNSHLWTETTWMGVTTLKAPSDMWNYQEILFTLKPSVIVEFGTRYGGSALYFAAVLRQVGHPFRLLSVDIDADTISALTRQDPDIELMTASSTDPRVAERIAMLRREHPGPVFAILDSDHAAAHVLGEMKLLRPLLVAGDYLIVEDTCVNNHPVAPEFGPGPMEAVSAFLNGNDQFVVDEGRQKYHLTFNPRGYLRRMSPQ